MKKNGLVILLVLSLLFVTLLVGCTKENATDNYLSEINEALKTTNLSKGAAFALDIKSNGNTITQENTVYTASGSEVTYVTTTNKPNSDLFGDKTITETTDGLITKAEYFAKLYYSATLTEADIDGKIEANTNEAETIYSFKAKNASLFLEVEANEVNDLTVSLKKSGNRLIAIEFNYTFKGYSVNTKCTINY